MKNKKMLLALLLLPFAQLSVANEDNTVGEKIQKELQGLNVKVTAVMRDAKLGAKEATDATFAWFKKVQEECAYKLKDGQWKETLGFNTAKEKGQEFLVKIQAIIAAQQAAKESEKNE